MRIGIIGLGYVGLPLVIGFAEAGHDVIGIDIDERKISSLNAGVSYIEDVADETLEAISERFAASSDPQALAGSDALIICVPTPLSANREPDLRALQSAAEMVRAVIAPGQIVVLESTTYPGCTRDMLLPVLEDAGLRVGEDVFLAFSPERIDPGRTDYTLRTTPKVVGGMTDACLAKAAELYREACDEVVEVSSPEAAELTKLLENVFRTVNIALVNELAMLTDRMGIDIWEVVEAASTKPYGFMRFEPGPGMGGHCLPVDPFYLSWQARKFDLQAEFIELAGKVNQQMPYHCVQKVERALNEQRKSVNGAKICLLGVSYKAGVGDTRESPALKIITLLQALGAELVYHDAFVPELGEFDLRNSAYDEAIGEADAVVIVTQHPGVDYEDAAARAPLLVDLRGATRSARSTATTVRL
ncbi:MAG: nucleotide sugar dehydrogenase [Patulibacter sp.]|nr:nucleotide sugar dehydrogenase [Patulibacter sp.]